MNISSEKRLIWSLAMVLVILIGEVAGGIISGSLALLSDAGHVLTDAFALGLSMIAARISRKPADQRATYGYQRAGILAAMINGTSLVVIAIFIFIESYRRFLVPPEINAPFMLSVAALGFVGNVIMVFILGGGHKDLNLKSAWLHVMGDTLSSIGVIISGVIIYYTGWLYADPVASVIIGLIIIAGGIRVVRESVVIFLELVPKELDVENIAKKIAEMSEVMGIHDVHLWSLAHKTTAFSAHIWVHDQKLSETGSIRKDIEDMLRDLNISHILLQFECAECEENGLYCQIQSETDIEGHGH